MLLSKQEARVFQYLLHDKTAELMDQIIDGPFKQDNQVDLDTIEGIENQIKIFATITMRFIKEKNEKPPLVFSDGEIKILEGALSQELERAEWALDEHSFEDLDIIHHEINIRKELLERFTSKD